jgi:hypothetical protein
MTVSGFVTNVETKTSTNEESGKTYENKFFSIEGLRVGLQGRAAAVPEQGRKVEASVVVEWHKGQDERKFQTFKCNGWAYM